MHSTLRALLLLAVLCTACEQPPAPAPTLAEEAREISAVFESPQVYTVRTLDSSDIGRFLRVHPEYAVDSIVIHAFYKRRHHQFAWFVNDSLSQSAVAFATLVHSADTTY